MNIRRKRVVLFSVTFVLMLLVCLAAMELYLRKTQSQIVAEDNRPPVGISERWPQVVTVDTPQGKRLIPGSRVVIKNHYLSHRDIKLEINSLGFRDEEIAAKKEPDEFRLLVLGDSIAFGDYLPAEEVFVQRLEHYLHETAPGRKIQAINAGISDCGLDEELSLLEERGLALQPDVVLVEFYLNDSRPPWGFPGENGYRNWLRRHSLLAEYIWKSIKLKSWLSQQGAERFSWLKEMDRLDWAHDPAAFARLAYSARYDWGAGFQPDSWPPVAAKFRRLAELAEKHGFRVIVAFFPVVFQAYARFEETSPQTRLAEIAAANRFGFVDLLPMFRKNNQERLFFDQCHPIAKTNDLIGRALAAYLVENGFINH